MNIQITPALKGFKYAVTTENVVSFSFEYFAICTGGRQLYGTVKGNTPTYNEWTEVPLGEPVMHIGISDLQIQKPEDTTGIISLRDNDPHHIAYPIAFQKIISQLGYENIHLVDNTIIVHADKLQIRPEQLLSGLSWNKYENATSNRYEWTFIEGNTKYGLIIPRTGLSPEFSVIIPFRNSIPLLHKAVKSVLKQTWQSFEIILINDHSDDADLSLLNKILAYPGIKLIDNISNVGQSVSMNIGLQHASGKYIFQLDADDWITEDALEVVFQFNEQQEFSAIYGNPYIVMDENIVVKDGDVVSNPVDFFSYGGIQAPRIYKTTALKAAGGWAVDDPYTGRYYEDRLMLSKIAEKHPVGFLNKQIYYVSVHGKSLSRIRPLETASAKLSILVNEANKRKMYVQKQLSPYNILKAALLPRPVTATTKSWSVIIPFSRSKQHLQLALQSWQEAIAKSETPTEVICVNDHPEENLDELLHIFPFLRIFNTGGNKGPAYTRNLGISSSQHDLLFFSDEDHIVPPDVLAQHDTLHCQDSQRIVVGNVWGRRVAYNLHPDLEPNVKHTILRTLWYRQEFEQAATAIAGGKDYMLLNSTENIFASCFDYSFSDQWKREWGEIYCKHDFELKDFHHSWIQCATGNMSISRENIIKIGCFNESLSSMEDWEFGIRAQKAGYSIMAAPYAEPFHIIHPKNPNQRSMDNHHATQYIKSVHPGVIEALEGSVYLKNIVPLAFPNSAPTAAPPVTKAALAPQNIYALTFDDGPHEYSTHVLLDRLQALSLKGTFFVLGARSLRNSALLQRILQEGHELGIHNWHHRALDQYSYGEMLRDILKSREVLQQLTGTAIHLFRPPYGRISSQLVNALRENQIFTAGWNTNAMDWAKGVTAHQIITNVAVGGMCNKVLLFHDGTGEPDSQYKALQWLQQAAQNGPLQSVTLSEYFQMNGLQELLSGLKFI
ncbi:glycosyltransferase [Chitinophaga sp. Hz27]|uniref:glycosyltransferase n=1 Tax=Chitinophaga sp. Hz27 TaxID=3347169 RepID=UPI0035D9F5A7